MLSMACNHLNFLLESCKTVLHIEYGKNRSFVGNAQLSFEKNQALKKTLIKTGFLKKNGFFWFFSKFWFFSIPCCPSVTHLQRDILTTQRLPDRDRAKSTKIYQITSLPVQQRNVLGNEFGHHRFHDALDEDFLFW